ncbi:L,D-transpeptidase [Paenibacillus macquariensis]|uniref:Lipoprotein-anchoring transpeptidase ErfK/SrfK n=1 Tax=Paenibacillus macquariensis TaxID=948756 RepID=A0ABY1JYG2_9BACL|nr:L,D-transpeptidase [Paenibacillus macquariensis]MEC0089128.1 L,D-transpeptidase [Paenibacillus macquariensis]OAB33450.1 hypothetical protein PMSM_15745 [Paenibacillus macquariensis subsp. macquariensis]SIQ98081.1 Lipoprotein-anchoring transpeptidase ErfK/SrfK [Paenibacillus macquariensis]
MKDLLYLKKYVELHSDNKMGWYLLGKEYEKNGEEGKANYCFNQSGEVYEAFELSKVPDDLWMEHQYKVLKEGRDKERRLNKIRNLLLGLVMILLFFIPTINVPGQLGTSNVDEQIVTSDSEQQPGLVTDVNDKQREATSPVFTAQAVGSIQERSRTLSLMLSHPGSLPVNLIVLGMERKDKWLLWKHTMPIAFTLKKSKDSAVTYQSYNLDECDCKLPEEPKLKQSAEAWIKEQENLLVLSRAIRSFTQQEGRVPVSLSELVQPFPRNVLSGSTDIMKRHFGEINAAYAGGGNGKDSSTLVQKKGDIPPTASAALASGDDVFFKDPIEVIVDKKNHRLAVVSGNIMLRNYKVGLGGAKTPEDEFVISDKVVNPNGSATGEFGSRGMQLSDSRYAIHGTDEPNSIGRDESNGCVRMSKDDVEELFDLIPRGTKVRIVTGELPDDILVPTDRYQTQHKQDQTNPHKTYHWL